MFRQRNAEVIEFGKPHANIYDFTFEDGRRRVLRKWDRNFRKEIKAQEKKKKSKEGKAA